MREEPSVVLISGRSIVASAVENIISVGVVVDPDLFLILVIPSLPCLSSRPGWFPVVVTRPG